MKKRFIGMMGVGLLLTGVYMGQVARPSVTIDGREVIFEDAEPMIIEDRTMIPIREVLEALGYQIMWDGRTQTVRILTGENPDYRFPRVFDEVALTAELTAFMARYHQTVSIFYENFETGFSFTYMGDRVFFGASATKAPFGLYLLNEVAQGRRQLTSLHTYSELDEWGGSGIIRHEHVPGDRFTLGRLIELMMVPSDNIATRILHRYVGLEGHRRFWEELGGNPAHIHNLTYSHLTAHEAGIFLREAYRFMNEAGSYGLLLQDMMLRNRYAFITASYPVGSKSGWSGPVTQSGGGWHDMAIVFAPSVYGLAILTDRYQATPEDRRVIAEISQFIENFNHRHFIAETEGEN